MAMAVGEYVPTKFVWLLDNVEAVGTIYKIGDDDLDIIPDPNYQHLIGYFRGNNPLPWEPTGAPGLLHCETYDELYKPEHGGINRRDPWPLPQKPDGAPFEVLLPGGSCRPLKVGDHVRVAGRWVIDHHPEYCSQPKDLFAEAERCRYRGWLKVGQTHTELHPFDWQTITLVEPLRPGDIARCTVSLAAPLYEEQYVGDNKWFANELAGVSGHVFIDDQQTNYHTMVSARIQLDASPAPLVPANVYRVIGWGERILKLGQNMRVDDVVRTVSVRSDGIEVQVAINAMNSDGSQPSINDPASDRWVFQAEYTVFWITASDEISCVDIQYTARPPFKGPTIVDIQGVGGVLPDGTRWILSRDQAVAALQAGHHFYITNAVGTRVEVVVARNYLTTLERDGGSSLLALPQCPSILR
jgi:hypothetical protein